MPDTDRMAQARRIYLETGKLEDVRASLDLASRQRAYQLVQAAARNAPLDVTVNVRGAEGTSQADLDAIRDAVRRLLVASGVRAE